jgi:Kef-type K+ transport system membrane component KefB
MTTNAIVGLLCLWLMARTLGMLATKVKQPAILGELLAGVIFTPSFLGSHFRVGSPLLATVAFWAGVAFLFAAGFRIPLSSVKKHFRVGFLVSVAGALFPFALGYVAATQFPALFGFEKRSSLETFGLFLGVSLAVSALPVIARTLLDVGVYHTAVGSVIMTAVILDDIFGWVAFSALVSASIDTSTAAWFRFHFPVIAYLSGVALGELARKAKFRGREWPSVFVNEFCSPLFFASIGLKLGSFKEFDLSLALVLIGIASVGKIVSCTIAAKIGKMPLRDSLAVGFAMNSRGAMSILLSSLSRDLGIIGDRLFLALVIMALVTSMASGPALKILMKPSKA